MRAYRDVYVWCGVLPMARCAANSYLNADFVFDCRCEPIRFYIIAWQHGGMCRPRPIGRGYRWWCMVACVCVCVSVWMSPVLLGAFGAWCDWLELCVVPCRVYQRVMSTARAAAALQTPAASAPCIHAMHVCARYAISVAHTRARPVWTLFFFLALGKLDSSSSPLADRIVVAPFFHKIYTCDVRMTTRRVYVCGVYVWLRTRHVVCVYLWIKTNIGRVRQTGMPVFGRTDCNMYRCGIGVAVFFFFCRTRRSGSSLLQAAAATTTTITTTIIAKPADSVRACKKKENKTTIPLRVCISMMHCTRFVHTYAYNTHARRLRYGVLFVYAAATSEETSALHDGRQLTVNLVNRWFDARQHRCMREEFFDFWCALCSVVLFRTIQIRLEKNQACVTFFETWILETERSVNDIHNSQHQPIEQHTKTHRA